MIDLGSRALSITRGLVLPDDEAGCSIHMLAESKGDTPSYHEMVMSREQHRWPEMRRWQGQFFNDFMDKVTEYETDILRVLRLPRIETVRESFSLKTVKQGGFRFTRNMQTEIDGIFDEWEDDFIDYSDQKAIYQYYMLGAIGIGIKHTYDSAISQLRKLQPEMVSYAQAKRIFPTLDRLAFKRLIAEGVKRIKDRLGDDYKATMVKYLKRMSRVAAREGIYPLDIARWIHQAVGEGQAWYWRRLAVSESVLGAELAFDEQGRELGFRMEEWNCASNPCEICSSFCGRVWPFGEGPVPVNDTHPFCQCGRNGRYQTRKPVQARWDRPTPYERAYTREEIEAGIIGFGG